MGPRYRGGQQSHNPSNLRVATDVSMPYLNGSGRTAPITSATPRSGESFASSDGGRYGTDIPGEERHFEKIFLSMSKSTVAVEEGHEGLTRDIEKDTKTSQATKSCNHSSFSQTNLGSPVPLR